MRFSFSVVFVILMLAANAAEFRLYNVVPMYLGHEKDQAARCVELYERTGVGLALYSLSLHPEGCPASNKVDRYVTSYRAFARALEGTGVRPGILVQSILGHWPRTDKGCEPWERTIDQDGKAVRFCPLDSGFGAYIDFVFRALAREHPAFVLTDDDVRAYSHGAECFCPVHVCLFNARHATGYTSETLRKAVAEAVPGDAVYDGFLALQREMIESNVVGRIRKAIDSVDSSIPAGICVAGEEHLFCAPLARAMAAKGQTPVMRCSTGLYGEGMSAEWFPDVYGRMLGFAEYYRGAGINLLDEADTCPQNIWSKSARSLFTHLTAACFVGMQGAKTWYINGLRATGTPVTRAYTDILAGNRGYLSSLAAAVENSELVGLAIPCLTNHPDWHVTRNHAQFFIDDNISKQAAVPFGVPFRVSREFGRPDIVFALTSAAEVSRLSDADLERLFSGRVFVFREAAVALTRRGFSRLTGVSAEMKDLMFNAERDEVQNVKLSYTPSQSGSVAFTPVSGAEILANFTHSPYVGAPDEVVSPSTVWFRNRLGGEVIVTAYHANMFFLQAYSEGRKRWFVNCLDRLSGGETFVVCGNDQHVLMAERRRPDGCGLVMAVNLNPDPISRLSLRIPEKSKVRWLSPQGLWRGIAVTRNGTFAEMCIPLAFYESAVFEIR